MQNSHCLAVPFKTSSYKHKENGTFSFWNCPHWSLNEAFQCMGKMFLFVLFKGVKGKVTQSYYFTSIKSSRRKHWWKQLGLWRLWVYVTLVDKVAEKAMATHSRTLAGKIPWMEEPGGLQSMGSRRVRYDWATSLSLFTFMHWRRKWQPTPVFLPGESQGQGEPGELPSMGSHRLGQDWSDLAAAWI